MILAGDVGGTKTLLGLFEPAAGARPRRVAVRAYATAAFPDILAAIDAFAAEVPDAGRVRTATLGVAGPVDSGRARLTNGAWTFDTTTLSRRLGGASARLLNDLAAMAHAVPVLHDDELATLQEGEPAPGGGAALIAAGTGLGEAALPRIDGRFRPAASEAGHADFAARTDREIALLRALRARHGRVRVEDVVSGRGLVALHGFTHADRPCDAGVDGGPAAPSAISEAAQAGRCPACMDALEMFVDAYGAEAGNLALRTVATGGVYVGGGIAPKILPALRSGRFIEAFRDKAPMQALLARVPVRVILEDEAALLGAAVAAGAHATGGDR